MNLVDAKKYFFDECKNFIDASEMDEYFYRIIEFLTHQKKMDLVFTNSIIPPNEFDSIIREIKLHKPLQYILGFEWFGNFKIFVNQYTLIPRPETEELVLWVLESSKSFKISNPFMIDIGTGSGCIPIYLKSKLPNAEILAMDIDENALKIAIKNATENNVIIDFFQDDILNPFHRFSSKFDIIISNPPYILLSEKNEMSQRVLDFEPSKALFVTNNDALQFYKATLFFAQENLKKGGLIFFEVHQQYANEVYDLCNKNGYQTELRKDIHGNNRMIKAIYT